MDAVTLTGWIAAAFTLSAFSMRTMLPLRLSALGASAFFIAYGWLTDAWPVLALHALLLPFNAWRLLEILRLDRAAREARRGDFSLDWIRAVTRPRRVAAGSVIFEKGDAPDALYYLASGRVELEDIGITLSDGDIFGEIAFFTNAKARTLTARAATECEVLTITERDFMRLYGQNPAFSIYLMRLVTERLLDGVARAPDAYRHDTENAAE